MLPEAKPRGTLRGEGKQNSQFPVGPVIKCFVIPPTQSRTIHGFLHGICRCFKGARPDHVRVEISSHCFPREFVSFVRPRELASFVRPRELVSFDP